MGLIQLFTRDYVFKNSKLGSIVIIDETRDPFRTDVDRHWKKDLSPKLKLVSERMRFDLISGPHDPNSDVYMIMGCKLEDDKMTPVLSTIYSQHPKHSEPKYRTGWLYSNIVHPKFVGTIDSFVIARIMRYLVWRTLGEPLIYSYVTLDKNGNIDKEIMKNCLTHSSSKSANHDLFTKKHLAKKEFIPPLILGNIGKTIKIVESRDVLSDLLQEGIIDQTFYNEVKEVT